MFHKQLLPVTSNTTLAIITTAAGSKICALFIGGVYQWLG